MARQYVLRPCDRASVAERLDELGVEHELAEVCPQVRAHPAATRAAES